MENILSSIVLSQKETKKSIDEQTKLLTKIYALEEDRADIEKRRLNEEKASKRRAKKEAADGGMLKKIVGDPKKAKKGGLLGDLFGTIGKLLMGLGGLGILKALGIAAIGTTIGAYFKSPEFRKFVDTKIMEPLAKVLVEAATGIGGMIRDGINKAPWYQELFGGTAANKERPFSTSQAQDALSREKAAQREGRKEKDEKTIKALEEITQRTQYSKGMKDEVKRRQEQLDRINHQLENGIEFEIPFFSRMALENARKQGEKELQAVQQNLLQNDVMARQLAEQNGLLEVIAGRTITAEERQNWQDSAAARARAGGMQTGGPVRVPGSGSGDKVPFMLPGGSFVMNRNAVGMLQSGGMVPTLLEPGEEVYGPGQWNSGHAAMNSMFGRFQQGGPVVIDRSSNADEVRVNGRLANQGGASPSNPDNKQTAKPSSGLDTSKAMEWVTSLQGAHSGQYNPAPPQIVKTGDAVPDPAPVVSTGLGSGSFTEGQITKGPIAPGGKLMFIGDGSGFTGELRFIDGNGKAVGSYGGVSGIARTAQATQDQRKNVSGAYNPIPDGKYALQSQMGPGSEAVGSFAAWVGDPSGSVPNSRGEIFLHNDIGNDGTQGCIGVGLDGTRGPNAHTKKFTDFYNRVGPGSVEVDLASSAGRKFAVGEIGGGSGGDGDGGGGGLGFAGKFMAAIADAFSETALGPLLKTFLGGGKKGDASSSTGSGADISAMATEGDTKDKAILDLIASVEAAGDEYGGFNTSRGTTEGRAVDHSIQWLADNAQGAIGRYQHMPQFLAERADAAGISRNTKFTPEVQDKLTLDMMRRDGKHTKWKDGSITSKEYGDYLSRVWRGLPHSSGGTYPDQHAGGNKAHMSREDMMTELGRIQKLQQGGVANLRGGGSANTASMVKESQKQFAQMIGQSVTPVVVPMGGSDGGTTVTPSVSPSTPPPMLQAQDNSVMAMEYKYRITMGASI